MRQKLVLHAVELLNDGPLVKVVLDLVFCHTLFNHWFDQVLEDLPEKEEVVALGDDEIHRQVNLAFFI